MLHICCGVVQVEVGGKYFYHRNMSTLVAFTVGGAYRPGNEFKVKDFFLSTILALFRVEYVPLVRYFSFLVKNDIVVLFVKTVKIFNYSQTLVATSYT